MRHATLVIALLAAAPSASAQEPIPQAPTAQAPIAQPPPPQGWTFGLRTGIAVPAGSIAANASNPSEKAGLRDDFPWAVPLVVEAGFRVPAAAFGLYYQYGLASVDKDGPLGLGECRVPGMKCDAGRVKRFGFQVAHPFAGRKMTPWIGGGIGWEWTSFHLSDPTGSGTITYKGFELMGQGGLEFPVSPRAFVGPYASVSLARYSDVQLSTSDGSGSMEIDEKRWHEWFQIGLRARFDL